jgi:hypothetical protein
MKKPGSWMLCFLPAARTARQSRCPDAAVFVRDDVHSPMKQAPIVPDEPARVDEKGANSR